MEDLIEARTSLNYNKAKKSCSSVHTSSITRRLEQEQEQLVQAKEKELFEQLLSQKSGGDVNVSELKQYVQV